MTVNEYLNTIKSSDDYVVNSLQLISSDIYGCIYKYLIYRENHAYATRKEVFIELNSEESELQLLNKAAINFIEVNPAK